MRRPSGCDGIETTASALPEKPFMIFAPNEKRVVENTAVHADSSVDFRIYDGGGADDHAFDQIMVRTAFRNLSRQAQIVRIEFCKAGAEWYISQELTSPFLFFTIVFTVTLSYCQSSRPTGSV